MSKSKKAIFFPVSIDFVDDERFAIAQELGGASTLALWLHAMAWAKRKLTDGKVPVALLRSIYPLSSEPVADVAGHLVKAGLWRMLDDRTFEIVGWSDWNDSAAEIEIKRGERREADRAYQQAKRDASKADGGGRRQRVGNASAKKSADDNPTDADVGTASAFQPPSSEPTDGRRPPDSDRVGSSSEDPLADDGPTSADVGNASATEPVDGSPTLPTSAVRLSRATEIRDQRVNNSTHTPRAGVGVQAGAREPMSPGAVAILDELQRHPALAAIADADRADILAGRAMLAAKEIDWVLTAIADAAADIAGGKAALNEGAMFKHVRSYTDRARRPEAQDEATASSGSSPRSGVRKTISGGGFAHPGGLTSGYTDDYSPDEIYVPPPRKAGTS